MNQKARLSQVDWGEEKGPGVALIHERGAHRHQDSLLCLGSNVRIYLHQYLGGYRPIYAAKITRCDRSHEGGLLGDWEGHAEGASE